MATLTTYILSLILTFSSASAQENEAPELSFSCDLALATPKEESATKLRIANFDNRTFKLRQGAAVERAGSADLLSVDYPTHESNIAIEKAGYLLTPMDIIWTREIVPFEEFLDQLKSKDRIQFEKQLASSEDTVRAESGPLTKTDFRNWYKIYDNDRISKERGPSRIKRRNNLILGSHLNDFQRLFFYDKQSGDLLGGVIFRRDGFQLRAPFEAYKETARPLKLEYRAFAEIMNYGAANDLLMLYYGPSWNIFGQYSRMTELEFNASLGMLPSWIQENHRFVKVLNTDILNRDYVIFAWNSGDLVAHHFTDRPRDLKLAPGLDVIVHRLKKPAKNSKRR